MTPSITLTQLREGSPGCDLLVVGPSLGTSVEALWGACAARLGDVQVVGWDLPGHGRSPASDDAFSIADLADSLVSATRCVREQSLRSLYAGVSLGGAVGLHLAVDHPGAFEGLATVCSGAKIGEAARWRARADLVRRAGTPVMVEGSALRWFAPGSIERDPATATALLTALRHADRFSYARCCDAMATYDVRDRLGEVSVPVLAIAGAHDEVTTMAFAEEIAAGTGGRAVEVADAAHLAPAEQPGAVAALLTGFFGQGRSAHSTVGRSARKGHSRQEGARRGQG